MRFVGTATLVFFPNLWVHLSWTYRASRLTRHEFLVRGLGTMRLQSAKIRQLHPMASISFRCYGRSLRFSR